MRSFFAVFVFFVASFALAEGQARFSIHSQVLKELNPNQTPPTWTVERWSRYAGFFDEDVQFHTRIVGSGSQETGEKEFAPVPITENALVAVRVARHKLLQLAEKDAERRMYPEIDDAIFEQVCTLYYVTELRLEVYPTNDDVSVKVLIAPQYDQKQGENAMIVRAAFDRNGQIPLDVKSIYEGLRSLLKTPESRAALKGIYIEAARLREDPTVK